MPNKLFIFHVRPGKYENTLEISYQQSDLDLMAELIDQQKGYGRIYIQTSRRTGKPYAEIRQPEGSTPAESPAETTPAASPDASPAEGSSAAIPPTPPVDDTETPF